MKVYTRTGDRGTTSLVGGERISKDDTRLEAYGTVDELNSWIGILAADTACPAPSRQLMDSVQNRLFDIGGYLATAGATECPGLADTDISALEDDIDRMNADLPPLRCFVLPGGSGASARAQVTRTVCRRAERRIVALDRAAALDRRVMRYVNRLSDWLFVYARYLNLQANIPDVPWTKV